jgi:hypothetical protein
MAQQLTGKRVDKTAIQFIASFVQTGKPSLPSVTGH